MTSQPINPPKPHHWVELETLIKFAKFHYTPNNKKVMMGGTLPPPPTPGCDEPKKPRLDRVKLCIHRKYLVTTKHIENNVKNTV